MNNNHRNDVLGWIRKFQNVELEDGPALADIEASSARVCALSEHIIGKLDFGAEPSGYLRLLDESGHGGDDHD